MPSEITYSPNLEDVPSKEATLGRIGAIIDRHPVIGVFASVALAATTLGCVAIGKGYTADEVAKVLGAFPIRLAVNPAA